MTIAHSAKFGDGGLGSKAGSAWKPMTPRDRQQVNAFAEGPFGDFYLGGWKVAAYTNDANRTFSHCAAAAQFESGIYFLVSVNVGMSWSLGFVESSWRLRKGETIPIDLTFDGRKRFHVYGEVVDSTFVKVDMPLDSALIRSFRWAHGMTAYAKGQRYGFTLTDTSRLLPSLVNCVEANRGKTEAAYRADPPSNAGSAGQTAISPEFQIEAIELATNFILNAQLQNPRVLSRAETPTELASFGAAWKSDEAVGAVGIIGPDPNINGIDVASAIAADDSKDCKGKFASGRVSEMVDSQVVFRGFSSCEDSGGQRTTQFFVVPRKRGGFVIFSVAALPQLDSSHGVANDDHLAGFQKAALTAAN